MHKDRVYIRRLTIGLATFFAALVAAAAPTYAAGNATYNNATVSIHGGNAKALSACLNLAKTAAKHSQATQSNFCKNFAKATGGTVSLKDVDIFVGQSSSGGGKTHNKATVDISGGDATAVAACVNYLQGTASSDQTNLCKNSAVAQGGDVKLDNVSITVLQG